MLKAAQTVDHKYMPSSLSAPTLYLPPPHHLFLCSFFPFCANFKQDFGVGHNMERDQLLWIRTSYSNIIFLCRSSSLHSFLFAIFCFSLQSPVFTLHPLSVHPLISFSYPAAFNLSPLLSRLPGCWLQLIRVALLALINWMSLVSVPDSSPHLILIQKRLKQTQGF